MIFDAHTHVHFPAYEQDRNQVIKRAQEAGVKMICVGTQFSTSESAIKLAEQYPNDVWATAGFHPSHFNDDWYHDWKEQKSAAREKFDIKKLKKLAEHPKIVAIGECGLDYFRLGVNRQAEIERQQAAFLQMAALARDLKKPLMIHCRPSKDSDDAYEDLLGILKEKFCSAVGELKPIAHFYNGSFTMTKELLEAGFYFTFGGVITFARDYDDVINYIPLDRILLETDAPYVAPEPYRGKRNEPAYVVEVAKAIARIRGGDYQKIIEATLKNTLQIFNIRL